jgi:NADH:ubiquinone oxidoreductase subunit B-like Fe-S oxidoreductase
MRSELQRQGIWVTSMQELYNWGRKNSIWPLQFGLACCAIEMIATAASRYDIARFGGEVFPAIAASGRPDDRGRNGHEENGAANCQALQPDA